jgi:hypothetical protein
MSERLAFDGFVEVEMTERMKTVAIEHARIQVNTPLTTIFGKQTDMGKNLVGEWGHQAFKRYLIENNIPFKEWPNDGKGDLWDFLIGELWIDVKTSECSGPPKPHYEGEVCKKQMKKKMNYYVFARRCVRLDKAYIGGCITKERFEAEARERKTGEYMDNGRLVSETMMCIEFYKLDSLKTFHSIKVEGGR